MNRVKTATLLAALTALFSWAGSALGGPVGLGISMALAAAMNVGAYWFSDRIVLRMNRAQEVGPLDAPELYGLTHELASRAQLPIPKVYIIPEAALNAFAAGRSPSRGSMAVMEGLLSALNREELGGVIAHELGHLRTRHSDSEDDGHPAAEIAGALLAPVVATVIQLAISRAREFDADEAGARVSSNPLALANALRKLDRARDTRAMEHARPATGHEERIARLESMAVGFKAAGLMAATVR